MSYFVTFLIGFCIGGVVGCGSPRTNTNLPLSVQPQRPRKYK